MGSVDVTLYEALVSAGIPPERARAVVDGMESVIDKRYALHAHVLATRSDIAELELRIAERFAAMVSSIDGRFGTVDSRFAAIDLRFQSLDTRFQALDTRFQAIDTRFQVVETRIAEAKVDVIRWTLTALTAQSALLLGAMKLF